MKNIEFVGLKAQQLKIKEQLNARISAVLSHGKYILGPEVFELEERLSNYINSTHCVTCANGTDALQISLMAIGLEKGDEVITPSFSYIAAAEAIELLGGRPVYVDVSAGTFNIEPDLIEEKITAKTRAIIAVSLFGQPADFDRINSIAQKHNLIVIEDAAQSFGAVFKGRKSCNLTQIACTSFFPSKPLGCYGDGGAIFTNDDNLAIIIKQIARHGQVGKYDHIRLGINSRLDTLQAAVLLAKMDIFDQELDSRAEVASFYDQNLRGKSGISTPKVAPNDKSAWAQYTIKSTERDKIIKRLSEKGIPTAIYYPKPLYRQTSIYQKISLPITETLVTQVLSLPMNPYLSQDQLKYICSTINDL